MSKPHSLIVANKLRFIRNNVFSNPKVSRKTWFQHFLKSKLCVQL